MNYFIMDIPKEAGRLNEKLLSFTLLLLVVLLQFQSTLTIADVTVRLSISDCLLPFFLLFVAWAINSNALLMPTWRIRWLPAWLILFSGWLLVSLIQGYLNWGILSKWAVVNKFFGWFILMGYFFSGGILGGMNKKNQDSILNAFIMMSWVISFCSLMVLGLRQYGVEISLPCVDSENGRTCGFLENSNAFGFFCVFVLFLQLPYFEKKIIFSRKLGYLGMFLNLLALLATTSRGALLALFAGTVLVVLRKKQIFLKLIMPGMLVCIVGILSTSSTVLKIESLIDYAVDSYTHLGGSEPCNNVESENKDCFLSKDGSIQERVDTMILAYQLWKKSPITGIGLGGFLENQEHIPKIALHNTAVWLLTETGLIGLGLMLIFCFASFKVTRIASYSPDINPFALSGLFILIAFLVASMTSEVMYQRYLWFFLGVLLVRVPRYKGSRRVMEQDDKMMRCAQA